MSHTHIRQIKIAARFLLLAFVVGMVCSASAQTFTTLYSFTGTPDGANPFQSNLLDLNGTFYGTTGNGGQYGFGTIFKVDATGKETVLYSFTGAADGAQPSSGLTPDGKGNFYGTTFYGGNLNCDVLGSKIPGCGVVYKFTAKGALQPLYAFTGGADGAWAQGLALDGGGNLYGVAYYGGDLNCILLPGIGCGDIYKISSTGAFSTLYSFQDGSDGGVPEGFVTLHNNILYAATQLGGNLNGCGGLGCGVLFAEPTSGGTGKTVYAFTGGSDGGAPLSQLLFDASGNMYGTTYSGGDLSCSNNGSVGCGVVFKLTPKGKETVIHAFKGTPNDAANPSWGLTVDSKGNGYGTTLYGGTANVGAIFKVSSNGVEKLLYSFTGGTDGAYPQSGLTIDGSGNLFSNAVFGGDLNCSAPNGCGTVFKLVP